MLNFIYRVSEADPLKEEPLAGDLSEEERCVHALAVQSLCGILHIIPLALDMLLQTLSQRMPYVKRPARQQAAYVSSLLLLSGQLSQARPQLLRLVYRRLLQVLVYRRLLQLDVLCPRDSLAAAGDAPPDEAVTLDALMMVVLRHMESVCYPGDDRQLDWAATKLIYADLIKVFEELALPTPSTAHAQFWLFWLAGRRLALAEHLIDWLWRRVENPRSPAVLRQAAAGYIGSFLARANIVSIDVVRPALELMAGWVHRYLTRQDGAARERADFTMHRPFYAVCQTLFYVFAFRHTEMPPTRAYMPFLRSLNYERMVTSQLNPLRFCLPAVVKNFANVARHYQLAYCYTVIERNNRVQIPVVVSTNFGFNVSALSSCTAATSRSTPTSSSTRRLNIRQCSGSTRASVVVDSDSDSDSDDEMEADAAAAAALAEFQDGVSSPGFKH
ncbi:RNA polymerase I-specific transcription initiation factor RRN3-like [Pollicipes pollicipes]|uniref:RNA polymerase I-specific transcription initiation factor RRN3-like n=1 Tax=Pollicipes pollicipes TaxID=41117 RepID=UPI001884B440|nr:RNA polymerase I-specific transcription initiation factor RRN3-like [Pollicipes pollicipes]